MFNIKNGLVLYGPQLEPVKANILIDENEIIEVSSHASGGKEIDARGCIVSPSLINGHVHLGDSVAMDIGDGKKIDEIVKPPHGLKHRILSRTSPQELISSMKRSLEEMLQTGTTTIVDFREGGLDGINLLKKAGKEIPIRKIVLGRHDSFFKKSHDLKYADFEREIRGSSQEILSESDGIGLSGFGEIDDEVVKIITKTCTRLNKISAIHAAEYEEVQKESIKLTGKTEVERALENNFNILIHLNSPINDDLDLLEANKKLNSKTSVVCCPRSNGTLSVGIPPIMDMWNRGVNLVLGTDNLMFNSPNMFREMEYALKVTRGYYKSYFPPVEILKMATVNAGKAFNMDIGCIEEGKLADIMIVEQLSEDPIMSLVNRTESKNIIGLMTDGNLVYLR